MTDTEPGEYYTATSLARAAGVHITYTARLCRAGIIPAQRLGNAWLILEADARAWLAQREARRLAKAAKEP